MTTRGYLNIVLHAHLPFVRHLDKDNRLEERWLYEALTESYIPLVQAFQRLALDKVDFCITLSLSPTLISMLSDELLQHRYEAYLTQLLDLAQREVSRTQGTQFYESACTYQQRFQGVYDFFQSYDGNILTPIQELSQSGHLELITSAATHAFLPYIQSDEMMLAQIGTAVDVFRTHFHMKPPGIWLPECAYTPRVVSYLQRFNIKYFFVDSDTFSTATGAGGANANAATMGSNTRAGIEAAHTTALPLRTQGGLIAFARDAACSQQVWSSEFGYPGDFDYREYYRDIGFDLDETYIGPYIHSEGIRFNTGFKYYRITDSDSANQKQPYDFSQARIKAEEHAQDFLRRLQYQLESLSTDFDCPPVLTAPYDAELFGHWWYEGPEFLESLLRQADSSDCSITTTTPSQYLAGISDSDLPSGDVHFSTWGRNGYGEVWLNESNDWIYPLLHTAESQLKKAANRTGPAPDADVQRAFNQAARELMLAESSDWAFMMDTGQATEYAISRTHMHLNNFTRLLVMIEQQSIDLPVLEDLEFQNNLFPLLDYRDYWRTELSCEYTVPAIPHVQSGQTILMLSWEFPPNSVGGLARHVYDLSRNLVAQGCTVHVITANRDDKSVDEQVEGVQVHRVAVMQPDGGEFIHFVLQLNLALIQRSQQLIEDNRIHFDVIHAHDWLVDDAARTIKQQYGLPLVATIHATEHGRNHGIFTATQRHIHNHERNLTHNSDNVVVCSSYMLDEVKQLFDLPEHKLSVVPNGVDSKQLTTKPELVKMHHSQNQDGTAQSQNLPISTSHRFVLFIGRLVREKGVDILIQATHKVHAEFSDVQLVIVGTGPMLHELVHLSADLNMQDYCHFTGYASDEVRNYLLATATVAVFPSLYEPFGIVALEAMAAGRPLVVTDVGGLADIVQHNDNGLKVPPADSDALASAIVQLLDNHLLCQRLTQSAAAGLSRFDWASIARQTATIYHGQR